MLSDLFLQAGDNLTKLSEAVLPGAMLVILIPFIFALFNRSIMGEMNCGVAILMGGLGLYFLGVIWMIKDPYIHYSTLAGFLLLMIGPPLVSAMSEKITDREFAAEQLQNAYQQYRMNLQNYLAIFRIGRLTAERGAVAEAVAIVAPIMGHLPQPHFHDEHLLFAQWVRDSGPVPTTVTCPSCGKSNDAHLLICQGCLGSIYLERANSAGRATDRFFPRFVIGLIVTLIVLVAIPAATKFAPAVAIPVILVMMGASIWAVSALLGTKFK